MVEPDRLMPSSGARICAAPMRIASPHPRRDSRRSDAIAAALSPPRTEIPAWPAGFPFAVRAYRRIVA
jgi:hypothetical protein